MIVIITVWAVIAYIYFLQYKVVRDYKPIIDIESYWGYVAYMEEKNMFYTCKLEKENILKIKWRKNG